MSALPSRPPPYSIYRASTIGSTLFEALKLMKAEGELDDLHIQQTLGIFDTVINDALEDMVQNKVSLTGQLDVYRHCDAIWTLIIRNARITGPTHILTTDSIKVVAPEHRHINHNRGSNQQYTTATGRSSSADNGDDVDEESDTEALINSTQWEDAE